MKIGNCTYHDPDSETVRKFDLLEEGDELFLNERSTSPKRRRRKHQEEPLGLPMMLNGEVVYDDEMESQLVNAEDVNVLPLPELFANKSKPKPKCGCGGQHDEDDDLLGNEYDEEPLPLPSTSFAK